jgi:hypothetical protein
MISQPKPLPGLLSPVRFNVPPDFHGMSPYVEYTAAKHP